MNTIISIHLNGKAFQIEENGHDALKRYLEQAGQKLGEDPDTQEIISDLEQAIADKFSARLHEGKDVVTSDEIEEVLKEMGPVESGKTEEKTDDASTSEKTDAVPKRLYLVKEGAVIMGVCTGIAAYFGIDVVLVRLGFIILTFLTGGMAIVAYIVFALILPRANTPEDLAAAYGEPFNAKEVIDRANEAASRAKESAHRLASKYEWKSKYEWRSWKHEIRAQRRAARRAYHDGLRDGYRSPFYVIIKLIILFFFLSLFISLFSHGMILGWTVAPHMSVWLAAILLLFAYHIVMSPFRAYRYSYSCQQTGYAPYRYTIFAALIDVVGTVLFVLLLIYVYAHVPAVHDFVNSLPAQIQGWIEQAR